MADASAIASAAQLLAGARVAVLTGAGISTESGIPDYRGEGTRARAKSPIRFSEFVGDAHSRRRYWARSTIGWPKIARAEPNMGHRAIARLAATDRCAGLITQNVDSLHRAAGTGTAVELHGALADVVCLVCGERERRSELQRRLVERNPSFADVLAEAVADGDASVPDHRIAEFEPVGCRVCDGQLRPDVVFFGESVPRERVARATQIVHDADALLVVGSSLTVYSGFRFARQAAAAAKPIVIINKGDTRADELATHKLSSGAGVTCDALERALPPLATATPSAR